MESIAHWATKLEVGDRFKATLRHKTDGTQNKHNVDCIVISVHYSPFTPNVGHIIAHTEYGSKEIPFCELKQHS